jgi:hypothetical protein
MPAESIVTDTPPVCGLFVPNPLEIGKDIAEGSMEIAELSVPN